MPRQARWTPRRLNAPHGATSRLYASGGTRWPLAVPAPARDLSSDAASEFQRELRAASREFPATAKWSAIFSMTSSALS